MGGGEGCRYSASALRQEAHHRRHWCIGARMVIAHIIDSMEVGGAEAVVAALCRMQAAAGHQVSVECLYDRGAVGEQLQREGVPVHVHGPASSPVIAWRLFRSLRATRPTERNNRQAI